MMSSLFANPCRWLVFVVAAVTVEALAQPYSPTAPIGALWLYGPAPVPTERGPSVIEERRRERFRELRSATPTPAPRYEDNPWAPLQRDQARLTTRPPATTAAIVTPAYQSSGQIHPQFESSGRALVERD